MVRPRSSGIAGLVVAAVCALAPPDQLFAQPAPSQPLPVWTPNGVVAELALDGSTLLVGGTFDYVGPLTGGFGIADASNPAVVNTAPRVLDGASAVVADGSGGWYVATGRGSSSGEAVAHVLSSGQRDPAWTTPVVTGNAIGLTASGGRVYVWGFVTAVNGQARAGIAAIDGATGDVLPWDAHLGPGPVVAVALDGGRAYIGGSFLTAGGLARNRFAVLDAATGAVLPATLPDEPGPGLVAVATAGGRVYVSAFFDGSITLRAYDAGLVPLPGWTPVPSLGPVLATPTAVYHATWRPIDTIVAAVDPTTGQALPFAPVTVRWTQGVADVKTLALAHGRLYVGGLFDSLNGQPARHLSALDAVTGARATWSVQVGGTVTGVAVDDAHVAIAGAFASVGGIAKRNLVTIDLATGRPTVPQAPDVAFTPRASLRLGDVVLVGGDAVFTAPSPGPNLIAYARSTGALLPWSLAGDSTIEALATDGRELFIGGSFLSLSGLRRPALASVDLQTAAVTSWNPDIDGTVTRLQVSGHTLYALGYFSRVQGEPRPGLTAFDTTSRSLLGFNPAPGQHFDMAVSGDRLLLSGTYFPDGTNPAAYRWVDRVSGADVAPTTALARPGGRVTNAGGTIYGTTRFQSLSQPEMLVAIDALTGALSTFGTGGALNDAFAASGAYIAVGIAGPRSATDVQQTLAVYRTPAPGAPRAVTANVTGSLVSLGWQAGAPPAATSFTIDVGTSPGGSNIGVFPVGTATRVSGTLPSGTYFARVRAVGAQSTGGASSELIVTVPATNTPPGAPGALSGSAADGVVSLSWGAAAGNATTYVIEAGTATGLTNIGAFATGHLDTAFVTPAPPGTYIVRVRAANAFGVSPPSNEVAVVVP